MSIRKGDLVQIISGDDIGKTGKIKAVLQKKGKVLIGGINLVYKHLKPNQDNPKGGRIQKEAPVAISNTLLVCRNKSCSKFNRGVRVRTEILENRNKIRVCVKCGDEISVGE
ncbi:MAG: 50S ribosomal protein L24 [Candidatus Anammoxibacter sp.]